MVYKHTVVMNVEHDSVIRGDPFMKTSGMNMYFTSRQYVN
jgi:hypothetical protein